MRDRFMMRFIVALAAVPTLMLAQMPGQQSGAAKDNAAAPYDSHDLSGVWDFFFRGVPGQGIFGTLSKEHPPMTPWAREKYDAARPGYGPRAVTDGNDPILKCNPYGIPRALLAPQPREIVQTPDRMFMFFEREHLWRHIWTDGREHPKDPEPTWLGDSIGKWEGDTFVIDTIGFNDQSWLDMYGDPHSEDMHLVERYKRVDQHTLTMQLIVNDPKAYTKTWVGDTKIYNLLPRNQAVMEELFCIPEQEDAFTHRVRLPAAGKQLSK